MAYPATAGKDFGNIDLANIWQVLKDIYGVLFTNSVSHGQISAHAGGGQALATLATFTNTECNVCATDHDSTKAVSALAGDTRYYKNSTAKINDFYPAVGEIFNYGGLLVNEPIEIGAGESIIYYCSVNGTWEIK
jgi:hypothetical protein